MIQMEAGEGPPPQKIRYRECSSRIQAIVKDYDNRNTLAILEELPKIYISEISKLSFVA